MQQRAVLKKIPTSELEKIFQTKEKAYAILKNHGYMLPKLREVNYIFFQQFLRNKKKVILIYSLFLILIIVDKER